MRNSPKDTNGGTSSSTDPKESPAADAAGKKEDAAGDINNTPKKKFIRKEKNAKKKAPPKVVEPPKTTARGEIVRKAMEEQAAQERMKANEKAEALKKEKEERAKKIAAKKAENPDAEMNEETEKSKAPAIKKSIPKWATLSNSAKNNAGKMKVEKPKGETRLIECIEKTEDHKGKTTFLSIKKYAKKNYPDWTRPQLKLALSKAIERNVVKQTKGQGLNGYFELGEAPKTKESLDDLIAHLFTWVCEPKEASATMIKKYIIKHYPKLKVEEHPKAFKKALDLGESKGQLERITGQGASGTFGLVDKAKKTGTAFEDAIEDAIIACNEPKDASVPALRHYLSEWNTEYNVKERPIILKKCLERCEAKGHIVRVTGKGFSGTFRLAYPYIPSPKELWRGAYEGSDDEDDESDEEDERPKKKKSSKKAAVYEESESDDSASDQEYIAKPTKRKAPTVRGPPSKKKKAPAKRPAKKAPVKRPAITKKSVKNGRRK